MKPLERVVYRKGAMALQRRAVASRVVRVRVVEMEEKSSFSAKLSKLEELRRGFKERLKKDAQDYCLSS